MALTAKQRIFVAEYLICWNSAEAARRAGYSHKTAREIGRENLSKPDIAEVIRAEIENRSLKTAEGLAILGVQARGSVGTFFKIQLRWTEVPLPAEEIVDEQDTTSTSGAVVKSYLVKRVVVDLDKVFNPEFGKLVKRFSSNPRTGFSIELYDSQAAVIKLLEAAGVFKQISQNLNVDISTLTNDQLDRIARGENPLAVLAEKKG